MKSISKMLSWFDDSVVGSVVGTAVFFTLLLGAVAFFWFATGPGIEPRQDPIEVHQQP